MDDYVLIAGLILFATFVLMSTYEPRTVHHFNHNFHYQLGVKPNDICEAFKAAAATGRHV